MFRIIPIYLFAGLAVGFLLIALFSPKPKIVVKYPTKNNAGKYLYADENNMCYRYKKEPVEKSHDNVEG